MDRPPIARGMRPDRPPLDDDSTARMLQGVVQPDDAPPGYGPLAGLLAAAARPAWVDEDAGAATVSAMVEAIREGAPAPQSLRRKSMLNKLLAGKALAAALGVVALTASGAAAATGSLPNPVQNAVAGAVSHVGVDLPHPGARGNSAGHRQDGVHHPVGDDGTTSTTAGPAGTKAGSGDDHGNDNGQGQEISDLAHQTQDDGGRVGPTVCAAASAGKCQAGDDHGQGQGSGSDDVTTSTTAGSNVSNGKGNGQAGDDPAGHDAQDNHGQGDATPPTTATPTTTGTTTGGDHGGQGTGSTGSGKGGSGSSGTDDAGH